MNRITNLQKFDENISQEIGIGATVTLFTFVVPSKCILRFTKFANYTGTPAAMGVIFWSIQRNGIPVSRYGALYDLIGQSFHPEEIQTPDLKGSDVLTVVVTNGHIAALDMGIRIVFEIEGAD